MAAPWNTFNALAPPEVPNDGENLTIGQRIRAARKALNLNQEALATRLGVSQPTVANWEADVHNPRQLMLAKLAEALDVSLGWLAGGEPVDSAARLTRAAAYLGRGLSHVPVVPPGALVGRTNLSAKYLHNAAIEYIPLSGRSRRMFGVFLDPSPHSDLFPGETLFVFDEGRTEFVGGCFALLSFEDVVALHRWPEREPEHGAAPTDGTVLGTLSLSLRFF
jgi:transcriptional regulator with XRE-family HTH domain